MNARIFLAALLVGGSVSAAGGGAYLAVRQNATEAAAPLYQVPPATAPAASDTEGQIEAPIEPAEPTPAPVVAPVEPRPAEPAPRPRRAPRREPIRNAVHEAPAPPRPAPAAAVEPAPAVLVTDSVDPAGRVPGTEVRPAWDVAAVEPAREAPVREEVVIPASAVIGLQVEIALSSERNEVEDRVDARVTRDVMAEGRVAIPAGSRVIGHVTLVDRGGKMRERARLGVRFHTVVLAGGVRVPLRTETIVREGESPAGPSARKIGGAAAGGAILGAIIGGGKGAAIGGAAGAGAGTAAVMAGDRQHATLPAGATLTARLSDPVVVELDRQAR